MEEEREYLIILALLARIIEANKGVEIDEKLMEAESLAKKFFQHSASTFYLSRGTIIKDLPSVEVNFFDAASINVLARAAVEAFLTFHYIFGASISQEERDFRFYSWQLGGLKERQKSLPRVQISEQEVKNILGNDQRGLKESRKFLPSVQILEQEAKRVLANDQKCIQNYERILKNNRVFLNLKKEKQKNILNGYWRTLSWREIALNAKLSITHAEHFYRYLCGYAHSSSLSTLQLSQANTKGTQLVLLGATTNVLKIAMSNFIFEYCKLFPNSQLELDKNASAKMAAEDWVRTGQEV
ncbi:MAG: hypothetical protein KAW16_09565 [candidate division Zixibacteria bacterium]|nr:hypothetical protein [candidate division Zixibacteria bacterium]MCK4428719.1 hypothetical protein [candidate division Zixibacteria bacterium]